MIRLELQQQHIVITLLSVDGVKLGQIGHRVHILLRQLRHLYRGRGLVVGPAVDLHVIIHLAAGLAPDHLHELGIILAVLGLEHLQLGKVIQNLHILIRQGFHGKLRGKTGVFLPLEGDIPQDGASGKFFLQRIVGRAGHLPLPQVQRGFVPLVQVPLYNNKSLQGKKRACRHCQHQDHRNDDCDPLCYGIFHSICSLCVFPKKTEIFFHIFSLCIMRKMEAYVKDFFTFQRFWEW